MKRQKVVHGEKTLSDSRGMKLPFFLGLMEDATEVTS